MRELIATFCGNLFCWWVGYFFGRKTWGAKLFGKSKAWIKIYKNGDSELHAEKLGDDIRMMHALCGHLKCEGYDVTKIMDAFYAALIKGNMPAENEDHEEEK